MNRKQRTTATVHLNRLAANVRNIQNRLLPGVELMAVLKGDGYSHGIAGIYPTLRDCGVRRYAVAVWEEGAALREAGATHEPILILGDTWDDQLPQVVKHRLTPTVFALETAEKLSKCAAKAGVTQPLHIKLDTGMGRIGLPCCDESVAVIERIAALPNLQITGLFTHFARADELERAETEQQFARFTEMRAKLSRAGVDIPLVHAANSPSILLRPEVQLQAVRAGDVLYGLCPIEEADWPATLLQEVLTWESYVALVKTVPAGSPIGYGGTFVTARPTCVATIPVGFADGYSRQLSNRGYAVIRGQRAPILGRVCMDQFMVDVTDIPGVERGDAVTLLGEGISILDMANLLERNVDEIVCAIGKRVPRVYVTE